MLRPGIFLQDRYEIVEAIGSGGMSDVYKAKCHKLNRMVAIKVLKDEFCNDVNFVSKFKMEAQAAAGLSHPNIVNVYDVIDEASIHYIVMELIEGITLKSYIQKKEKLEVKETIGIAIQVAQGIAAAHEQNIIHRDIKPQNMIISKDGKVKVADFGIARAATAQTISSAAMGSVHYISPEQARGGYSDARSDIYSLGITIYEMVTGRLPFEGDNTVTIALAHLEEPITRPSIYNPDIPVSMENIILKCTEKKPERRYHSVPEVISDLRKVLLSPDENFVKMAPVQDNSETITISPKELETIQRSYRPSSGKGHNDDVNPKLEKMMTFVGVIMAVVIVGILVFVFSQLTGVFRAGTNGTTSVTEVTDTEAETVLKDTEVYMPDILNLSVDLAEAKLKDSTLQMKIVGYEESDVYEKNTIMRQEVAEGTIVAKYSTMNVVVSNGSDLIKLSEMSLDNLNEAAATGLLKDQNLIVEVKKENNDTVSAGNVIRYEPDMAKPGDTITLYISEGPMAEMKTVPTIINISEADAIGQLAEASLLPGKASLAYSDTVAAGLVISQNPAGGLQAPTGSTVSYVVSQGPEVAQKRYLAAISETYNLSSLIGPGAMNSSVKVMIRLEQTVNGETVHKELMEPRTLTGQSQLPVNFPVIEGAPGVDSGEVQIVDVDTQTVIKTYPVTFFAME